MSDSTASPAPLTVLISGAGGTIGTELQAQLHAAGHRVQTLVRHAPSSADEHEWQPAEGKLDPAVLDGVDAVVNLSGASISRLPWTKPYQEEIRASRVSATRTIVGAIASAANPPRVLLNGSAVGFYGDRPAERLTEDSPRGQGFLAEVVEAWEAEAFQTSADVRVATLRTGLVLAQAGALAPLRLLTNLGLAGKLGTGGQVWPWISLRDEAAAIVHLLTSSVSGPVNLTGPEPVMADRLMRHLAKRLHRPYLVPAPEFLIRLALQEAGQELLLSSQPARPEKLLADGFAFRDPTVELAIDRLLATS
ncbi:TIGR01777 family oxidoreductase [Clavibacter nebraskensis]|uniref:TIGR01777 family oxidoreductase n=2 Tax=Clavibacter nebraskensis TaxID=31963 RepID=A0A399Q855_9MICO|nr:TIGR01777 family oxidoreductase [Clavibacter nebraskensis]KXU20184.1 nucleoside-diphosphate sugar epimerase [Clavibacter nebraskensis]OAH21540.1 nucleoside-diphosphate sugar epimerase [Clavibacter nebraskensis]QGV67124.1 TIGR01777 family protein [Clavibacter nebraskensis]QGV69921.1 TIGR01777 family protein [Clavibacter nebraskensis]QGV72712.1 TIGR01777 family protein [Clavibacter nebraskensis]